MVFPAFIVLIAIVLLVAARSRKRGSRRRHGPGPGAAGAIYDLLNEDKRNAIEIIVEEKAEARDPERAAGNFPDIEDPRTPR